MRTITIMLAIVLSTTTCKKEKVITASFTETKVSLTTHNLTSFSIIKNSKYLVVFESGLGDDHAVWNKKDIPSQISKTFDVLLYDRAGYGKSEDGPVPRNINKLQSELSRIIDRFSNGRKLILVGHSLGGMIIRDYAIKNPTKIAALLFVDPSHEFYNHPSQADEDMIYNSFKNAYGLNFGGTVESKELIENSQYLATLADLPNVPITVLTSMKVDAIHSSTDRQAWYNAHELLKNGVTDFTHSTTTNSGHYIMIDEPKFVIDNFYLLVSKLQ